MNHWSIVMTRYNKQGYLVISYEEKKVKCISLYSQDSASYESFNGVVTAAAEAVGGKNGNPSDHEDIHVLFGQQFQVPPESTKTPTTHFHWVFDGLDLEHGFFGFTNEMKKLGLFSNAVAKDIQLLLI